MLKLTYISHSAFVIEDGTNTIAIDPFITHNPTAPESAKNIAPNYIVVTHAHGDHLGDTIELAQKHSAQVIAVNELATWLSEQGVNARPMHIGGSANFGFGKAKLTIAHHGSIGPNGQYMGAPCGVVLTLEEATIYHTGDTGLFTDMQLIAQISKPDIMLLPIGDNFTMGIDDAMLALDFVKPKLAVPMHYNTFPIIQADPLEFVAKAKAKGHNAVAMNFGETKIINFKKS